MTFKEASKAVGRDGMLYSDGMLFPVRIVDARRVFGRIDYQVSPIGGSGSKWVDANRVVVVGRPPYRASMPSCRDRIERIGRPPYLATPSTK